MIIIKYIWKSTLLKIMNGKIGTFLLILLAASWTYNRPMKNFIQSVDYPVSWCLFPFFMASLGFLIFFWFGVIYVNSDVPFMQSVNLYHVVRAGRKRWIIGQIGGIFFRSLILVIFTVICTIIPLLPYMEWTNEWGKLLRTAAMSDVASAYHFKYMIYYEIFSGYTPIQLMGLCIVICTLVCTFLGVFMLTLCLYVNKICAVAAAAGWSVLLFFVTNQIYDVKYIAAFFCTDHLGGNIKDGNVRFWPLLDAHDIVYVVFFAFGNFCNVVPYYAESKIYGISVGK